MELDDARFALHARLRDVLGDEEATTLMAALPGSDRTQLVTTADLDRGLSEVRVEVAEVRADLRGEMALQTRTLVVALIGSNATLAALAFAAARLT